MRRAAEGRSTSSAVGVSAGVEGKLESGSLEETKVKGCSKFAFHVCTSNRERGDPRFCSREAVEERD